MAWGEFANDKKVRKSKTRFIWNGIASVQKVFVQFGLTFGNVIWNNTPSGVISTDESKDRKQKPGCVKTGSE